MPIRDVERITACKNYGKVFTFCRAVHLISGLESRWIFWRIWNLFAYVIHYFYQTLLRLFAICKPKKEIKQVESFLWFEGNSTNTVVFQWLDIRIYYFRRDKITWGEMYQSCGIGYVFHGVLHIAFIVELRIFEYDHLYRSGLIGLSCPD